MTQTSKVPWTTLFPGLDSFEMTRDSVKRRNHRHYRVKLPFKHKRLAEVRRKLKPYGFTCEPWHAGFVAAGGLTITPKFEVIKCIRQTPL